MSEIIYYYQDSDFWKPSLDIDTDIKTLENLVLTSNVIEFFRIASQYQDLYQDFLNCSIIIREGLKKHVFLSTSCG